jgi:TPR repeat protein
MKRVEVNDPLALYQMGRRCRDEGDFEGAIQYFTKAAALGDIDAHYNLSALYRKGEGGVEKDKKKEIYHSEEAAIGGHPLARYSLAIREEENAREDRACRHLIIASKLGLDVALDAVKMGFMNGSVSKEEYEAALRGCQAAVDATKSQQRDAAEVHFKGRRLSTN